MTNREEIKNEKKIEESMQTDVYYNNKPNHKIVELVLIHMEIKMIKQFD